MVRWVHAAQGVARAHARAQPPPPPTPLPPPSTSRAAKTAPPPLYFSFFLMRSSDVCPHFFLRQLVARAGRRA
jgi:hypothetical protein